MPICIDCGAVLEHALARRCHICRDKRPRGGQRLCKVPCKCGCGRMVPGSSNTGVKGRTFFEQACKDKYSLVRKAERLLERAAEKPPRKIPDIHTAICRFCGTLLESKAPHFGKGAQGAVCKARICQSARVKEWQRIRAGRPLGNLHYICKGCGSEYETAHISARNFCPVCAAARNRYRRVWHENVKANRVWERDGWKCQHCRRDTLSAYTEAGGGTHSNPAGPTLDHVLPIASGGAHSYANTQLLCWTCNMAKRDMLEHEPRLAGVVDFAQYKTAKHPPSAKYSSRHPLSFYAFKDRTGQQYGLLTLVRYAGKQTWHWRCMCGAVGSTPLKRLTYGCKRSCGATLCKWVARFQKLTGMAPEAAWAQHGASCATPSGDLGGTDAIRLQPALGIAAPIDVNCTQ